MATAAVSETVSQHIGGKFANGAITGAFVHMFNAMATKIGKYYIGSNKAYNGGKTHVHWGGSSNKRLNAINQDGTVRHGRYPPNKVKNFINNNFKGFKIPTIFIMPISPNMINEYNKCGINGCNL